MLKIRLRRMGARNHPFYRVVVSDSRRTPTASALEEVGHYDPRKSDLAVIDRDKVDYWVGRGAQMSKTVQTLLAKLVRHQPESPVEPASTDPATEAPAAQT